MGNQVSYDCYCPRCGQYVGSWWHYDWADAPVFNPFTKSSNDPNGTPYCKYCDIKFQWFVSA